MIKSLIKYANLTSGNPSLEREGYSWCCYQAGQGITPSYPLGLPYIPLFNRWNAHNITARENLAASVNKAYIPPKPQLFQLGKNDTMGKSHPLLNWERNTISRFNKCALFLAQQDHQKNFLWASRLWVGRRKEPILGYVPKNDEKKNSVHKGLSKQSLLFQSVPLSFSHLLWIHNVPLWIHASQVLHPIQALLTFHS